MTKARPKFLDPKDLDEAIAEVARIALAEGVEIALVGGAAMATYGSDRLTKDVDFASRSTLSSLPIGDPLSCGGYTSRTTTGHPVNIIIRIDEYAALYEEAIDRSVDIGLPSKVVLPEHLATLMMAAAHDEDMLDLKTLIRRDLLDMDWTRSIVKKHLGEYAARKFDTLSDEDDWEKWRAKERTPR